MPSRRRFLPTSAALAATVLVAPLVAGAAPADRARVAAGTPSEVLVFLRTPLRPAGGLAARAAVAQAQHVVAAAVSSMGGRVLARTAVPDALVARLRPAAARAIAQLPGVASVLPDSPIQGPTSPGAGLLGGAGTPGATAAVPCGTAKHPELEPEGLQNVDALPGATHGFVGRGVTVAFLADGLQANNPDLLRNRSYATATSPAGTRVIAAYEDFSGDGTTAPTDGAEAFGDAASIAAQGNAVYDLSRYVSRAHPLPRGCDARILGTAPGVRLLALKIYAQRNMTTGSGFLQAINYAVTHGASVINESFGSNPFPDSSLDVIRLADDAAVAAGVTVVASSGDAGPNGTIGSPASDPAVIAVGATTTFRAYAQDTYGGINAPGSSGRYVDDNISALSSGGIAQDGKTVDLVAPGDLNWSLCSANRREYSGCSGMNAQMFGGTSESAPMTSGAAADVIGAYAASHHAQHPSPALVKQILMSTARDVAAPADQQGAGILDVAAAVALARSLPTTTISPRPGGALVDATQLDLAGNPAATVSSSFHVTNLGRTALRVQATTRALVAAGVVGGVIQLHPGNPKAPSFPVWSGAPEVYTRVAFRVAKGIARIQLHAAYQFNGQQSLLHVALFDPAGAFAGYSLPQGIGDYADVEVARPAPGTWHAVFFTVRDGYHGSFGTGGPVPYSIASFRFAPLGSATPGVVTLAAGATGTITYRDRLPGAPGDLAGAVVLRLGSATTTVPVTLRTAVPLTVNGGSFSGVVTGGNGRGGAPGQTNTYDLVVPSGEHDLEVGVRLAANPAAGEVPGLQLIAELVDPQGQAVAYDSNYTVDASQALYARAVELYAEAPAAGTWQLVLDWVQPGAGRDVRIPFRVLVAFDHVAASVPGLPQSPTTVVPKAGASFSLSVRNTGIAELLVSPDARLDATTTLQLADLESEPATQPLPNSANLYYVPTETSSYSVSVTGTIPTSFDTNPLEGDPDLAPTVAAPYVTESVSPSTEQLTFAPPDGVAPGMWAVTQAEVGPYAHPEPHATETTVAEVVTQPFDPAVTSQVDDTVESLALGGAINPVAIAPGATGSIPFSITPTAPTGTIVTGTLYVTGFTSGSFFGTSITLSPCFTSVLAAIPYEYKVGS